ncbi:hypothetical protein ACFQT0_13980 [Hymenobacter humi]|uniref:T9SS type A sorting domain-containing protein n=1 Tax=Hymenobacter humi TaxID=1411620 RepID=A0ABW2U7J4_9BACT
MRITVTFAAPPGSAYSRLAPTLYNKTRVLQFEEDDSPATIYTDVYPLFHGGRGPNGQVYPGLRYTDGCGHSRRYTAAVAINGHNTYNNAVWLDPGPQHDPGKLVWAQAQELLDKGWDIENHSDLHTAGNPSPAQQIADLDMLIASRLQGYQPSVLVVPTNFGGYPTAAFAAGYIGVSSASQSDGLPFVDAYTNNRVLLRTLPAPGTPFVYRRYSADANNEETAQSLLNRLKRVTDDLLAPGESTSDVYLQRVFAHTINFNVLSEWMNYTQTAAQDRLWVTTLREFEEYRRVSSQVVKTESLTGNTLTINLDYSRVNPGTRFQSLTWLVDSPGTITEVRVTGADSSSFNPATKQVNVYRSLVQQGPPLPVQLTAFTARRESAGVRLDWRTASELNAKQFEVQRSADGRSFTSVGTVPSAGTSSSPRTYAYLDASVPPATNWYYRLLQIDNDGTRAYGPVVQVAAGAALAAQVRVAPNPAHAGDGLTATVDNCEGKTLLLQLLDATGRVVLAQPSKPTVAQHQVTLALPGGIGAGVYTLRVVGAGLPLQTHVMLTR